MIHTTVSQHLIIASPKDCIISQQGDFATIVAAGSDRERIQVSIHKDAVLDIFGELLKPLIMADLAEQQQQGIQFKFAKTHPPIPTGLLKAILNS